MFEEDIQSCEKFRDLQLSEAVFSVVKYSSRTGHTHPKGAFNKVKYSWLPDRWANCKLW